jgi:branched-subunit amino acid transport protein
MDLALLIVGMALVTFATRYMMIAILRRWNVSRGTARALEYVPIAAFAAIIAPDLLLRAGQSGIVLYNPRLVAGVAAILIALFTRRVLLTIAVGLGVLWIAQAVMGI